MKICDSVLGLCILDVGIHKQKNPAMNRASFGVILKRVAEANRHDSFDTPILARRRVRCNICIGWFVFDVSIFGHLNLAGLIL